MTAILIYLGKSAVALAVFYMFYRLLLSKETFHRINRIVLLGTAALSFVLPLCVITIREVVVLPSSGQAAVETVASGAAVEQIAVAEPWWVVALCAVCAVGALASLGFTLFSIIRVKQIIARGECILQKDGVKLVLIEEQVAPFSWMKHIVLSRADYEAGAEQILVHERAHIAYGHSIDLLFVDLVTALQWFNPAIWMLRSDLRALHEFEADDAVLISGADVKEYQYLLIKKAVGKSGYSVANSFNHSTLKNRITMMSNKKSSRMGAWKALYVLPLVGVSLVATAETKVDYRYEEQPVAAVQDTIKVNTVMVGSFPVKGNIKIEEIPEGKPRFVIDGKVMELDFDLKEVDPKTIESMEVLKDETAIEKYGEIAKNGVIVINLKKQEPQEEEVISFQFAGEKPSFNGGDVNDFNKWVAQNMRYPEEAIKKKLSGRVMVSFVVGSDGVVKDVKVLRGVDPLLDAEAVRVVSSSPKWTPATKDGEPVAINYTFPVIFATR